MIRRAWFRSGKKFWSPIPTRWPHCYCWRVSTETIPSRGVLPRDHYNNFSAVIYQNLGTTLAPIISLFGGLVPQGRGGQPNNMMQNLSNMKSSMIAAYGEPDRISIATSGNLMGMSLSNLITGNLQNAIPFTQFMGTRDRAPAFK